MKVLIVLTVVALTLPHIAIAISFGIHLPLKSSAQSIDSIRSTLIWNKNIVQCTLFPTSQDRWFLCNSSSINYIDCNNFNSYILSNLDTTSSPYMIHLDHLGDDAIWVDEIKVITDETEYIWTIFCSSLSFTQAWETQPTGNCNNYPVQEWTFFCMDGNADCNSYNAIDIILSIATNRNEALIQISTIEQSQILFCPKHNYLSFGVHVPIKTNAHTGNALVSTLNWNGNVVQCTLYPDTQDRWYLCDITTSSYIQCTNYDISAAYTYMMQFEVPSTSTDGLWIDKIKIIDYYNNNNVFIYDTFCSALTFKGEWETQPTTNCNDFTVKEWTFFCMDGDDDCNWYYIIDIILSYPPFNDEALVQSSGAAFPSISCTGYPTNIPTSEPTTRNPTSTPSSSPTNQPSASTKTPTFQPTTTTDTPTISPTKSPSSHPTTATDMPSKIPTVSPTKSPSSQPSTVTPTQLQNEQEQKDITSTEIQLTNMDVRLSETDNDSYIMYFIIGGAVLFICTCTCCIIVGIIYWNKCKHAQTKMTSNTQQLTFATPSTQTIDMCTIVASETNGEIVIINNTHSEDNLLYNTDNASKMDVVTPMTPSGNNDDENESGEEDLYGGGTTRE